MKKKRKKVLWMIFLLLSAGILLAYFFVVVPNRSKEPEQYSVILYQYMDSDWKSLLDGIRQGEQDEGVSVNYVTMPIDGTAENERELLQREVENGAEGILLAAVDSNGLKEDVEQVAEELPVVTLETGVGEKTADISADDYGMGWELGQAVALAMKEEGENRVVIIREYLERYSVSQRLAGLEDCLRKEIPEVELHDYQREEGDFNLSVCITNIYQTDYSNSFMVALDKFCTESLIEAAKNKSFTGNNRKILGERAFGIGNTEKIVNGLDEGYLRGLVYQNEFNMGYLGLQALIQAKRGRRQESPAAIDFRYVTRDTLYETENQRLLFPIN